MHAKAASTQQFLTLSVAATLLAIGLSAAEPADPPPASPAPLEAQPFFFALSVQDVERSAVWYQRAFGFQPVRSMEMEDRGIRIRLLQREGAFLELVQNAAARSLSDLEPPVERRFLLHGAFKVGFRVGDLATAQARLEELGIPLRGSVFTESDGSMRSLQVEDPDGNVIQVFEILE